MVKLEGFFFGVRVTACVFALVKYVYNGPYTWLYICLTHFETSCASDAVSLHPCVDTCYIYRCFRFLI